MKETKHNCKPQQCHSWNPYGGGVGGGGWAWLSAGAPGKHKTVGGSERARKGLGSSGLAD